MADPDPRDPGPPDDSRDTDSGHPYADGGAATDGSDDDRPLDGDRDRGRDRDRDREPQSDRPASGPSDGNTLESSTADDDPDPDLTEDELRRRVEERYDFDDFGPEDMAEMSPEEWDVAFDADTWITGDELLERVEAELKTRIADRDVFAVLEYAEVDGERSLVAYSDTDYAIVYPNGTVEGRGTVVRDVKPTVALCSMEEYGVEEPPERWQLPDPEEIPESGSELGNWMLQLLAATQLLVGIGALIVWPIVGARSNLILLAAGLGFIFIGLVLFTMVANARLSEKFRVQEYRQRLRSIGTASDERPPFLPIEDEAFETATEPPSIGDESRSINDDTYSR